MLVALAKLKIDMNKVRKTTYEKVCEIKIINIKNYIKTN